LLEFTLKETTFLIANDIRNQEHVYFTGPLAKAMKHLFSKYHDISNIEVDELFEFPLTAGALKNGDLF
ncbi:MAG: hypothetical protein KDD34_06430, partial [Bdellovibrionales bacterium]|nr:hypothetical protein [Bdellovibrionales bacterium]